jgi:hypothetical protein
MTTANGLIVSVSGIRGVIGRSLTPADALAFASALDAHVNGGRVVGVSAERQGQGLGARLPRGGQDFRFRRGDPPLFQRRGEGVLPAMGLRGASRLRLPAFPEREAARRDDGRRRISGAGAGRSTIRENFGPRELS